MSNDTGISAYKIYKWLAGKGNPKAEDAAIIKKWLGGNVDKVPNSNNGNGAQMDTNTPLTGAVPTLQDYINEIKAQRDMFYALLSSNLGNLQEGQRTLLAYQKAWVDQFAEKESRGDPDKKAEIMYRVNKLVDDILTDVSLSGTQTGIGTRSRG